MTDDGARRKSTFRDDGPPAQAVQDAVGLPAEARNSLGTIGKDGSGGSANDTPAETSSASQDPLAGMSEADKYGIKGLLALMAKYPAYSALAHGMNPAEFGLDLNSEV